MTAWRRLAHAVALALVVCSLTAIPARADRDDDHWQHHGRGHWRHDHDHYRGGATYYVPERHYYYSEPDVYYAPPPVYVAPPPPPGGISFIFPFHIH
jgi:hypothetical protein